MESNTATLTPPGRVSSSATLGAYSAYLESLHRNSYAAYIRLHELEKAWGLWHLTSPTRTMPFDPIEANALPSIGTTTAWSPAPGPLYRLAPALGAIELTMRLLVDFMEVNVEEIDDPDKSYLMRSMIDIDLNAATYEDDYLVTTAASNDSLAQPHHAWWGAQPVPRLAAASFLDRIQCLVQCHFQGLPFGPGILTSHAQHVPYDAVVLPRHVRTECREADAEFVEDHFFATVHQIVEAWCCVMERQLDAAQAEVDDVLKAVHGSSVADTRSVEEMMQRIARRYRWAGHCWEYMIDHISMLSEMDARDYLSLKFHLHGASGGQSVRLRQLTARIPHLLPWGTHAHMYTGTFDPAALQHVVAVLSHVRSNVEDIPLQSELVALFKSHVSPAAEAVQLIQAVQMLENAVRRFYFGHQQLAIMVLGAVATGTQELTVKALERGWKTTHRYICVERAKEVMSQQLSDAQSPVLKGRIVRARFDDVKVRHHKLVVATDNATLECKLWQSSVDPLSPMSCTSRTPSPPRRVASSPYRPAFARSLATHPVRTLHFTTYGMGLPPDVALASVQHTHALLCRDLNEVWSAFFQHDVPTAERYILQSLGLESVVRADDEDNSELRSPEHYVNFGANVHEFLVRLFSCLTARPLQVVTSDAEFVSLTRQLAAWTAASGDCQVHQVPLQPVETFAARLCDQITAVRPHVVHVSAVYSNSQFRLPDTAIASVVDVCTQGNSMCIVDVAQAIENVPMQLPRSSPVLVVVGSGIKHCTAGPGLGFIVYSPHSPWTRPLNTGWIAHTASLQSPPSPAHPLEYTPELAFAGGTPGFHYALRQLNDVQAFYANQGWTLATRHAYTLSLQAHFLAKVGEAVSIPTRRSTLAPEDTSRALVLEHSQATAIHQHLMSGAVVCHCDVRFGKRLRLGFGLHHVQSEVDTLADALVAAWKALDSNDKMQLMA
ncbi:hypothetical protein DYB32_006175 [Aphanomyces invadans]|uniref:Hs1pro-1 C-terminal domain-containing protein n=1 Tax=Aphanomyces invadans TaxID=157072 RepID=A0A3R6WJU5_9STRA|nr:hypothetical protein DYB32_006175 [Aphanomyces invadans]